ncbi:ETC complex I subunit [Aquabacter sp. CN5-332]|uniref:ETC complex I subunit n=1 Tax=Aquabacter sp. CN5-332 TaxID=3156608 RepID=UPI0032B5FA87
MVARIFRPARNAMQSGVAKTKLWVLEYEPEQPRSVEPLMGYTSSGDMRSQVKLHFETKDEAIAYAERHNIAYQVFEPHEPVRRRMAYSDNFTYRRAGQWTH